MHFGTGKKENAANSKQFIYSKDESQRSGNLSFYCTAPQGAASALRHCFITILSTSEKYAKSIIFFKVFIRT